MTGSARPLSGAVFSSMRSAQKADQTQSERVPHGTSACSYMLLSCSWKNIRFPHSSSNLSFRFSAYSGNKERSQAGLDEDVSGSVPSFFTLKLQISRNLIHYLNFFILNLSKIKLIYNYLNWGSPTRCNVKGKVQCLRTSASYLT